MMDDGRPRACDGVHKAPMKSPEQAVTAQAACRAGGTDANSRGGLSGQFRFRPRTGANTGQTASIALAIGSAHNLRTIVPGGSSANVRAAGVRRTRHHTIPKYHHRLPHGGEKENTMAYVATGTAGGDTLDQSSNTGPGTIVGLAGDDAIFIGSGLATVTGDSGNDSVFLQTGNTGTVNGGTENDFIISTFNVGSMQLFGGDGADTIFVTNASAAQTIVGGNDSSDGNDFMFSGTGADLVFGNGGNDTLANPGGNDTFVGGFGNDFVQLIAAGSLLYFGNQGNDTVIAPAASGTLYGGLGNDVLAAFGTGSLLAFGNEGSDTVQVQAADVTVVGGNDSADAGDSLLAVATGTAIVFGNGGADTTGTGTGAVTAVGGQGNDFIQAVGTSNLVFANEGNDSVFAGGASGRATIFGGLGNDIVQGFGGRDSLQGNEGNDSLTGDGGTSSIDTISGGAGNDLFAYANAADDGNNATGGGPVELITDLNWAEDKVLTQTQTVTFAANLGAGTGADLAASANNALAAAQALSGGNTAWVAAQFTFSGHTYLAIDQANHGAFDDTDDLLLDITGVTGTISSSNFI
jgi:Ca2+-binding RTX toxin-like protein